MKLFQIILISAVIAYFVPLAACALGVMLGICHTHYYFAY